MIDQPIFIDCVIFSRLFISLLSCSSSSAFASCTFARSHDPAQIWMCSVCVLLMNIDYVITPLDMNGYFCCQLEESVNRTRMTKEINLVFSLRCRTIGRWMNETNQTVYLPNTSPSNFFSRSSPANPISILASILHNGKEQRVPGIFSLSLYCYCVVFQSMSYLSHSFCGLQLPFMTIFSRTERLVDERSPEKTCAVLGDAVSVCFRPRSVSFHRVTINGIQMTFEYRTFHKWL